MKTSCNFSVQPKNSGTNFPQQRVKKRRKKNTQRRNEYVTCDVLSCTEHTEWTEWSECTVTCGGGKQYRHRNTTSWSGKYPDWNKDVIQETQSQTCNEKPCLGNGRPEGTFDRSEIWFQTVTMTYY